MMNQKIRSLQGLRGWAMLMIVLWHLNSLYPGTLPKLGDRGVEFFLLISGFLIARKCEGTASLDSFRSSSSYVFQKIKSSYLLFILPAVPVFILDVLAGPVKIEVPLWQLLSFCSLTQSWIPDVRICWGVSRTGWFLPVLLYCYLITPLIRKAVRRFGARPILLACLVIQVASELLAKHFLPEFYYEWFIYIFPAYRALDFTLGFCAWHIFRSTVRKPSPRSLDVLYLALLAILTALSLYRPVLLKYVLFHPFESHRQSDEPESRHCPPRRSHPDHFLYASAGHPAHGDALAPPLWPGSGVPSVDRLPPGRLPFRPYRRKAYTSFPERQLKKRLLSTEARPKVQGDRKDAKSLSKIPNESPDRN